MNLKNGLFFLLIFLGQSGFAQWQNTKGPYNGSVCSMLTYQGVTYAGTFEGIYASSDNGRSWKYIDVPGAANIFSLVVNDSFMFASTNTGILRSADKGLNWVWMQKNKDMVYTETKLYMHDNVLYASIQDTLFLSVSNGLSWKQIFVEPNGSTLYAMAFIDSFVFFSSGSGTYRSENQGLKWKKLPIEVNTVLGVNNSNLFVALTSGLYISRDFGITWEFKDYSALKPAGVTNIYFYKQEIIISTSKAVLKSSDSGETWRMSGENILSTFRHAFSHNDSFLFLGLYGHGVFRYDPRTGTWSNSTNNMNNTDAYIHYSKGSLIITSTIDDGVLYSEDLGEHWNETTDTFMLKVNHLIYYAESNDTLFAMMENDGIVFSVDNGKIWEKLFLSTAIKNVKAFQKFKNVFYIASNGGFYVSYNMGQKWELINGSVIDFKITEGVSALSTADKFYISMDQGKSWVARGDTFLYASIYHIEIRDSLVFVMTSRFQLHVSKDYGKTWECISTNMTINPRYNYVTNFLLRGKYILASNDRNIFISKDMGETWVQLSDLPYDMRFGQIYQSNKYLFVASTQQGIWFRPFSDFISSVSFPDAVQSPLKMYPNPTLTGEKFSIESALVKVGQPYTIYDIYGSVIKKAWVDDNFKIETDSLRTGIYMIEIKAGDTLLTGKLLVN